MPTVQVIDREDPARNPVNAFQERLRLQQETISNVQYKMAQVAYQKELAKIEAKKAETETAQFQAQQDIREWEVADALLKQAYKTSEQEDGSIDQDTWNKLVLEWALQAGPGVGKKFAMLAKQAPQQMPAEERLKSSQANLNQYAADRLNARIPQGDMEDAGNNTAGWNVPSEAKAAAVSGNLSSMSPLVNIGSGGNASVKFPEDIYNEQRIQTMATEDAKKEVEMAPLRAQYGQLKQDLITALGEMGGPGASPAEAWAKGNIAQLESFFSEDMPETASFYKKLKAFALGLGSYMNKGRPTDKDALAALDLVASPKMSKGVIMSLMRYTETLLGMRDPGQRESAENFLSESLASIKNPTAADKKLAQGMIKSGYAANMEEALGYILEDRLSGSEE